MDVSIIIVNYNTADLIVDCIESINRYTKDISFEIIVVDNNSSDKSCSVLEEKFNNIILIKNLLAIIFLFQSRFLGARNG